jgi:hypothetical protein
MTAQGTGSFSGTVSWRKASALFLPRETHEYKFVVNGVWPADPKCPNLTPKFSANSILWRKLYDPQASAVCDQMDNFMRVLNWTPHLKPTSAADARGDPCVCAADCRCCR